MIQQKGKLVPARVCAVLSRTGRIVVALVCVTGEVRLSPDEAERGGCADPGDQCGTVGSPWVSPATLFGFWETLIKFSESMILYGEKSFFRFFFFF